MSSKRHGDIPGRFGASHEIVGFAVAEGEGPVFATEWYEQFLVNGVFGPVRAGATLESIVGALGPPEGFGEAYPKTAKLISYGDGHLQVAFYRGTVSIWGVYFERPEECVELDGLRISQQTEVEELCPWLRQRGVQSVDDWCGSSRIMDFDNGIRVCTNGAVFYSITAEAPRD